MAKVKLHERWGDRKIVKQGQGVVILERETIDVVVAYDLAAPTQQRLKYYSMMGGLSRGEARRAATKEFKRRQK